MNPNTKHETKGRCVLNQVYKESGPSYDYQSDEPRVKSISVVNLIFLIRRLTASESVSIR